VSQSAAEGFRGPLLLNDAGPQTFATTVIGMTRDGAIASLKLKHVDVEQGRLLQDAREVRTKFSKTITTWFFPVSDEVRQIVTHWVEHLRKEKLFGDSDPLFPARTSAFKPKVWLE